MRGTVRWKDGAWRLQIKTERDPVSGKWRTAGRTVHAPNTKAGRRQAETELARFVVEVEAGRAAPRSGLTVAAVCERYIRDRSPGWSPGQADATRKRIAQHVTPHIGDVPVERLRPLDVTSWHAALRAAGMAEVTVARVHSILQAALGWAERNEVITRNPAARRRPRFDRATVSPPSPDDVARLLDEAGEDVALFLRIAALTGARRGQVCALQWHDIDGDVIRWRRALAKVPGGVAVKSTKTGAVYQTAIDPGTVEALAGHRARAAERAEAVGVTLAPDAYVFARDAASREPWHPDGASQRFAAVRARLKLDGVRLHDLRHYMATQLLAEGGDVQTLAGRGGWSNASTPLQVYAHHLPARDADVARRLADRLDHR